MDFIMVNTIEELFMYWKKKAHQNTIFSQSKLSCKPNHMHHVMYTVDTTKQLFCYQYVPNTSTNCIVK